MRSLVVAVGHRLNLILFYNGMIVWAGKIGKLYLWSENSSVFLDNSRKVTPKCEYWANISSMWKLQVPTGDARTPDPDGNHSMKGNIPTQCSSFHQSRHYTAFKVIYGFHSHPSTSVSLLTLSLVTAPHLYQRTSLDCERLVPCRFFGHYVMRRPYDNVNSSCQQSYAN